MQVFNSLINVIQFYTYLFKDLKDLNPMLRSKRFTSFLWRRPNETLKIARCGLNLSSRTMTNEELKFIRNKLKGINGLYWQSRRVHNKMLEMIQQTYSFVWIQIFASDLGMITFLCWIGYDHFPIFCVSWNTMGKIMRPALKFSWIAIAFWMQNRDPHC